MEMAATMLTSATMIPKLKKAIPITVNIESNIIYASVFLSGMSIFLPAFKTWNNEMRNMPISMTNAVRMGPMAMTGILNNENIRPHNTQVRMA